MWSSVSSENLKQRQKVEDMMLEWKCRVENPPRKDPVPILKKSNNELRLNEKIIPIQLPTSSHENKKHVNSPPQSNSSSALERSSKLFEKLPKILTFENRSGGGGAPHRSPSGRIKTNLVGDPEIRFHQKNTGIFDRTMRYQLDKEQIKKYRAELDSQLELKRTKNNTVHNSTLSLSRSRTHDESLATILGKRNHVIKKWESLPKLSSTDVTKNYVLSPRSEDAAEIRRGLDFQLENKRILENEKRKEENLLNSAHFSAFDEFWGRPGCGAPKLLKKKENLFHLLHSNYVPTTRTKK